MDLFSAGDDRFSTDVSLPPQILESKIHKTFQLERILTEDTSGMLFAAGKTVKGRRVAVAILSPGFSVVSKRLMAIEHPNIVKAHQIIKQLDGTEVVVMDLPEGNPLSVLFAHGALFSVNQTVTLVLQLLSAFHAIHKRNEPVRTIGSNNIFIEEESQGRLRLRLVNIGIGTAGLDLRDPNYVSPEQVMDTGMTTFRADIWTAGAIFFHLLFGRPLFQGSTSLEVAQKIMLEDPVIDAPGLGIPPAIVDVLGRALQRDEHQRFRDVPEMVAALLPFRAAPHDSPQERPFSIVAESPLPEPPPLPAAPASSSDKPLPEDDTAPISLQTAEEDWSEAPTVPPDDPLADSAPPTSHRKPKPPPSGEERPAEPKNHEPAAAVGQPTRAEIPSAMGQETRAQRQVESENVADASKRAESKEELESETLVASDREKMALKDQTKIDDLAQQSFDNINAGTPTPAPTESASVNEAPRANITQGKTLLSTVKDAVLDQPALALALGVLSIVSIAFTIFLVSVLRNPVQTNYGVARQGEPTPPNGAERPSQEENAPKHESNSPTQDTKEHTKASRIPKPPRTVTIDLLRVPVNAKISVDGSEAKTPIKLPHSKKAVKLIVKAKGFKPFERLVVPDKDRKMVVEMEEKARPRHLLPKKETE